jgi:PadR family transcriptional regulator PadR
MKVTASLVAVAAALMSDPHGRHWGYALTEVSKIRSGVLYPILSRMLAEGWLSDGWESEEEAAGAKRPPRRYYQVTENGLVSLGGLAARNPRKIRRASTRPAVI